MAGSFIMQCLPNCPSPPWWLYAAPIFGALLGLGICKLFGIR
jgi:hypothetical protein